MKEEQELKTLEKDFLSSKSPHLTSISDILTAQHEACHDLLAANHRRTLELVSQWVDERRRKDGNNSFTNHTGDEPDTVSIRPVSGDQAPQPPCPPALLSVSDAKEATTVDSNSASLEYVDSAGPADPVSQSRPQESPGMCSIPSGQPLPGSVSSDQEIEAQDSTA